MANLAIFRCAYCRLDKVALLSSPGFGNNPASPWVTSLKQLDISGNPYPSYDDEAGLLLAAVGNLHLHTLQVGLCSHNTAMGIRIGTVIQSCPG